MILRKKFSVQDLIDWIDNLIEKLPIVKNILQKTRIRDNREKFSKLRTVYINHKKPVFYNEEEPLSYANNRIVTSKFILPDPPTNPYTSILPLAIVIGVTAIKQAYEDVIRHKSDWEVNSKSIQVLRNNKFETIEWKDIKCGDIVQVKIDEAFPCDLLLLYSKTETGACHIKTANLDGETNLKVRSIPFKFPQLSCEQDLIEQSGVLIYEKPNPKLYEFKGKLISADNKEYSISNENILLRGTSLKIAPIVYGCAIYTGQDSKMMLNSKFKANKLSCVERYLKCSCQKVFLTNFGRCEVYDTIGLTRGVKPQLKRFWEG